MAATGTPTPNIGLRRPQGTDPASVDDINYNSEVIDTKLGAVGGTSVQAQIDALNNKIASENSAYTPTITAGSGFSASQYNFRYWRFGKILKCMGRFNIDNAGSTDEYVRISLPSGMSCATSGVGSCGNVHLNKSYTGLGLSIRTDGGNDVFIQMGAGGKSSTVMGTGYVVVDFTVLLT